MAVNIIWSYWEGDPIPLLQKCYDSWVKAYPTWQINMLNKYTIQDYMSGNHDNLTPTFKSDIIRLYLLHKYGGMWLDATIIVNKPFTDGVVDLTQYYGFHYHKKYIESWALYSPTPGNENIRKWYDLLVGISLKYPKYNTHPIYSSGVTLLTKPSKTPYFMIYDAYIYLLKQDPTFKGAVTLDNSMWGFYLFSFLKKRHLIKYTKTCRKIYDNILYIKLFIVLIIITCIVNKMYK